VLDFGLSKIGVTVDSSVDASMTTRCQLRAHPP
jgi:hypothetical protein